MDLRFNCAFRSVAVAFLAATVQAASPTDLVFTTFPEPCRVVDTRLGGGALVSGTPRSFKVAGNTGFADQGGNATGCGVPTSASAVSMNAVAVNPQGGGNLRAAAYPALVPATGSIINYQLLNPNLNIANGLTFPICDRDTAADCDFDIRVQPNGAGTHLVIDILGYFSADHKHSGEDITTGTVAEGRIDDSIARDAEVMPLVLDGDGRESGLDADLLDGLNSDDFAGVLHSHSEYQRKYVRTVIVGPVGTAADNGAALRSALNSITAATASDPWLLKLEPGTYDLGSLHLTLKPFVDLEGSGQKVTRIDRSGNNIVGGAVLLAADDVEIRDLTVEALGGSETNSAVLADHTSPQLTRVTLSATGGGPSTYNFGFEGYDSSAILTDVTAKAFGTVDLNAGIILNNFAQEEAVLNGIVATATGAASNNLGIWITGGKPFLHNVRASISGSSTGAGLSLAGTSKADTLFVSSSASGDHSGMLVIGGPATVANVEAQSTGGSLPSGIKVFHGNAVLNTVRASATGGLFNYGISITGTASHTVSIRNSTLSGSANAMYNDGGVNVSVSASQLLGGPVGTAPGGVTTCAGVSDELNAFFASTCP